MKIAEIRAAKMTKINEELAEKKCKLKARRKKHRLKWRRAYYQKKKLEGEVVTPGDPIPDDPAEQKRVGKIKWRLQTCAEVSEVRTLAEWCAYICTQTDKTIQPLELEAIVCDERMSTSIGQIVEAWMSEHRSASLSLTRHEHGWSPRQPQKMMCSDPF